MALYTLQPAPPIFVTNPIWTAALDTEGNHCLPLILVNGEVANKKQEVYPGREDSHGYAKSVRKPSRPPVTRSR